MCIMCSCVALLSLWHQSILACEGSSPWVQGNIAWPMDISIYEPHSCFVFAALAGLVFSMLVPYCLSCEQHVVAFSCFLVRFASRIRSRSTFWALSTCSMLQRFHYCVWLLSRLHLFCRTARALVSSCRKVDGPSWAHLAGDALIGEPPRRRAENGGPYAFLAAPAMVSSSAFALPFFGIVGHLSLP